MGVNNYKFTENEVLAAYRTSVIDIVRSLGIELKDEGGAYRVPGNGGLFLFKHGCGYYHNTGDEKGNGIDFLTRYCGIKSKSEAIGLVLDSHGTAQAYDINTYGGKKEERGEFFLPAKAKNIKQIYWYLLSVRGIDKEIVSKLIAEKKIFQEAGHSNCIFVGFDKDNVAKYATARGTGGTKYQGEIKNSNKEFAFHIKGKSDLLFVCESPITAMSHATLMKQHGKDWQAAHTIALGGRSTLALNHFLSENPQIQRIVFALDNDFLGLNSKKKAFENHGQVSAAKMMDDYTARGYKCLIQKPHLNDFNDDLVEAAHGCKDLDGLREAQIAQFLATWQPGVGFLNGAEGELTEAEV